MAKIATTDRRGLNPAQADGNDLYKIHERVRDYVERSGLGGQYAYLFTIPVENGYNMDWYAIDDAQANPVDALPPRERLDALKKFGEMRKNLNAYAEEMRASGSRAYKNVADIIDKAMHLPGSEYIYAANGKITLVNWGFSRGDNSFVDDTQKLLKEINDKISDAESEIDRISKELPDKDSAEHKEEANPACESQFEEETPTEESQEAREQDAVSGEELSSEREGPEDTADNAPEAPDQTPSHTDGPHLEPAPSTPPIAKSPWMPAALLGAALVMAGAAAAWYFLMHKPDIEKTLPDASSSARMARGSITISNALINDNDEAVDMSLEYKDGHGKCVAREQKQACEGVMRVTAVDGNTIAYDVNELVCPNKDNYPPMTIACDKASNMCEARDQNGATWALEVNMSGAIQ